MWNVPPKNPLFTGRKDILEKLRDALACRHAAALYGMPGVGKTQTAVEFAHRHRTDYTTVLWAQASSPEALTSGYLAWALLLGLQRDERDQALVVAAVQEWLRRNPGWLVILDGTDDLRAVQDLLPTADPSYLLLTTVDPAVAQLAASVNVTEMVPDEGALLLLRRAGKEQATDKDREAALAISEGVGGLPLALGQAGAYIVECGVSPAEYWDLYEVEGERLRGKCPDLGRNDQASVTTTFSLAFKKVEEPNSATADLLRLCAMLGPEPIPDEIFLHVATDPGDRLGQACDSQSAFLDTIRKAYRLSLLRRSPESRTVSLHRVVREVIRDMMCDEEQRRWSERATRAVGHAFPQVKPAEWPACERLLPHAMSCFSEIVRWDTMLPEAGRLLNLTAYYLIERARYEEAQPLLRRALEITEQAPDGPNHPDALRMRHSIARWTAEVGDAPLALQLFHKLLATQERFQGPNHPDTLLTRHSIAYWTGELGDLREALRLCRKLLADQRRFLERDHPDTLLTRRDIARWTGEAGDARQALRLFRKLLPVQEHVQGPNHPDTLLTRHDIAHWTGEAGDARRALWLCLELLPDRERVQGCDHPVTLGTRHSIAHWTGEAGDARRALRLCLELLPDRERVQGCDHPDTLIARHTFARWMGEAGDARRALRLFRRLLPDQRRVEGPNHPDTLLTRRDIAHWTGEAGDALEALRLFRKLLPVQEHVQGPNHPVTLGTRHDIAHWTGEAGDARQALRLCLELLLPDQRRVEGPNHPDTLLTRHDIARWTGEAGDALEALRLLRKLLPILKRVQGRDHPDTLGTRHSIAHWTGEAGDAREALRLFRKLLADQLHVLGHDHPATLETQRIIARLGTVA